MNNEIYYLYKCLKSGMINYYLCLYEYFLFYSLDLSPELDTLSVGDRILEVNGISVKDNSIEMVRLKVILTKLLQNFEIIYM